MKRIIKLSLLLLALLLPATATAYDFEVDGIYYYINGNNAIVTYSDGNDYSGDVTIPETVTYNGTTYSVTAIIDGAFCGCSRLTSIEIPNTITSIGGSAFAGCSGLTSIDIPNSVTAIGNWAFSGCSALTNVNIGNSVSALNENTFEYCSGLTSINIPNSVTYIGHQVFYGCSGLTSINIPNSVTTIECRAFLDCSELINITVDSDNTKYDSRDNSNAIIETSSNTLIAGCKNTTIPNSITAIGESAFDGCSGLTSVAIPNSITSIGEYAFCGCGGLTSIDIPNSVTAIGEYAFYACNGLKNVYSYIKSPSLVTMGSSVFNLNPSEQTLHVPAGSLEAYQADTKWSQYFGSIVEMEIEPEVANHITVPDTTVMHGDVIALPVAMTNDATFMAFQTDIFLPEGFTIVTDEDDEYIITPSERLSSDHVIMSDNANNGSVRVICYTPNSQPISGNEGDLFYIHVQVPDDAEGDFTISLRNTLLTTVGYNEISAPDTSAVIEVIQFIPGDVNDSRTVNVTDIVVTAMYVLDKNPNPFVFEAADMNGDGNVTVTDIMLIAYLINHPTMNAPKRMPALMDGNDRMSGEGASLMAGETRTVSIMLDNEMDYTAFQMDLTLPEGLTASNFQLTDRAGNHAFDVSTLSNGDIRALCYSPAIEVIDGNSGALLTFDITATATIEGDITVDGIELVTTDCQTVLLNGFAIGVNTTTSVNEVASGKTVARVDYFNLAGQRIDRPKSGVTLVVTTYTDGTRTTTKVMK